MPPRPQDSVPTTKAAEFGKLVDFATLQDWQAFQNCMSQAYIPFRHNESFKSKLEYYVKSSDALISGKYVAIDLLFSPYGAVLGQIRGH